MKLTYSLVLFLLLATLSSKSYAQHKLSGSVVDGKDLAKLHQASVALLNPKDSVLITFGRTKENGTFQVANLDTGTYKMVVSYPQYADLVKDIRVRAGDLDIGLVRKVVASKFLSKIAYKKACPNEQAFIIHV